jgi:hypothetical protein
VVSVGFAIFNLQSEALARAPVLSYLALLHPSGGGAEFSEAGRLDE